MNQFIKSIDESLREQTNEIQSSMFLSECSIRSDLNHTSIFIGKGLISTRKLVNDITANIDDRGQEILPVIASANNFSLSTLQKYSPKSRQSSVAPE